MNDSVKLCIYLCGKDLHFYEKPQEFLLKLFYSQFRMTLKIMTASCTALLCQCWLFIPRTCRVHASQSDSLCLSGPSLVMCVMRPQCPDQSRSGPASLTLSIVVPAEIVPFYLLNYWCLFNKVWDWKIFTINLRLATCQRWRISSDTPYIATARLPYISLPSFAIEYFSNNFCIFILNKYSQIYLIETIYTFMLKTAINFVRKSLMNHQNHKLWVSSFNC